MKNLGAKYLIEMADYIAENPQFIVNGLIRFGITAALDRRELKESSDSQIGRSNTIMMMKIPVMKIRI